MALGRLLKGGGGDGKDGLPPASPAKRGVPGGHVPVGDLTAALGAFLTQLDDDPRIGGEYVHASSLYTLCSNQHVLVQKLKRPVRELIVPADRLTFDIGKAVHDWVRDRYLGPMGRLYGDWKCLRCGSVTMGTMPKSCSCGLNAPIIYVERAVKNEEWKIVGHLDGIDRDPQRGFGVLEIKTKDGNLFRMLKAPQPEHVFRTNVYCWLSGYSFGRIIYISKAKCDKPFKEFVVNFDVRVPEQVKKKLAELRGKPTRACQTPTDARALTCPVRQECWT